MVKKIIIIITVIMLAGAGCIFYKYERDQLALKNHYEELAAQIEPMNRELRNLKSELLQLENDEKDATKVAASAQFLFETPLPEVYTEAAQMLKERDFFAMIGVSEDFFPGNDAMMSIAQCEELLDLEWELCLVWDGQTPIAQWLDQMNLILSQSGLTTGVEDMAVYFPDHTWASDADQIVKDYGCAGVIEEKDSGSVITKDPGDDVWHVGAFGWSGSGGSELLSKVISGGGNLIYSVDWSDHNVSFSTEQFDTMLTYMDEYCRQDKLSVMPLDDAVTSLINTQEEARRRQEDYEQKKQELEQSIKEKQEEIDAVLKRS